MSIKKGIVAVIANFHPDLKYIFFGTYRYRLNEMISSENKPNDDISNTRPVAISDAIQNLYECLLLWEINGVHKEHPQQFGFK